MEFVAPYIASIFKGLTAEVLSKVIVYGVGSGIAFWLVAKMKRLRQWVSAPFLGAVKLQRLRKAINSKAGLFIAVPVKKHRIHRPSCDVVLVANLKGGVGKTTLTANLSAACARRRQINTLCIDFDYQGSLTSMAVPNYNATLMETPDSPAGELISSAKGEISLPMLSVPHAEETHLHTIPSDYPLAQVENRLMINWLIGDYPKDIRTQLAEHFEDTSFDRIFIDAPPRLTTSCVQGLFACTKVIIPTVLDRLSIEAVGRFVEQILEFRRNELCPFLKKIYVVGTIVPNDNISEEIHELLSQAMLQYGDLVEVIPHDMSIKSRAYLRNAAGRQIAYLDEGNSKPLQQIRQMFNSLDEFIWG